MATYKYIVTVQEPRASRCAMGAECKHPDCHPPEPIVCELTRGLPRPASERATALARAQYRRPDGTTVTIVKQRLGRDYAQPVGSLSPTGPAQPYRSYLVQGGVVRRVDLNK